MNVVHIAWNEGLSAVYPSQVLRPMSLVGELTGARLRLVVGAPAGELLRRPLRLAWRARQAMAEQAFGLSIDRLPTAPARLRRALPERALAVRWLAAGIGRAGPVILHCRGRAAAEIGLAVRAARPDARVIFDCRGWEGPELLYGRGFASERGAPADLLARCRAIEARQRAAALGADAVIVVSRAMREVALRQWGVADDRLVVVPCCADTGLAVADRDTTRARHGLQGRFVVVYCGSLARHQMIDASLEAFEAVRRLKRAAVFLALTPSPDRLTAILRERGLSAADARAMSVPHTEVPGLLAAADLALLIRERSKVNAVASPVKLAEYLAAGVPVVISEGVGDYSELVGREGIGCVLPEPRLTADTAAILERFLDGHAGSGEAVRARCRAVAERQLSAARAARAIGDLYGRLWRDLTGTEPERQAAQPGERVATAAEAA